jgi:putative hydrolase of the HAD superfamily
MIKWIGFDADDTLWDYEIIYHQAKDKITKILGDGYNTEQLLEKLDDLEIKNIPLYGYGIKSYALSLFELLASSSTNSIQPVILSKFISMIKDMLNTDFKINPHAEKTLAMLSSRFNLILITKGEGYEQSRKIEKSGLVDFFSEIEVVSQKTEATYHQVLKRYQIAAQNFLMVGNSLKSDILPVVQIGGSAVHIPHEQAWFHEDVPEEERAKFKYKQLEHLGELPLYIEKLTGRW